MRLSVCIVTHDDAADLSGCLESVAGLETRPLEVVVVDCGSSDDSVERARAFCGDPPAGVRARSIALGENRGFAGGMNAAVAATTAAWILTLNPDARPAPDYAERLIAAARRAEAEAGLRVGAMTGRLVRFGDGSEGPPPLDACGMYLTPAWRHHDRGSGEPDRGQHDRPERVFGATGAAALLRREALADAALRGDPFDPLFPTYREDAELAFRLRERGWEVLYEPSARCLHRRLNLPERRAAMPAAANYHSLKNRYLLRAYHQTAGNTLWTAPWALGRDLAALAYVLLRERESLGAYRWLWRHRRQILARRREIQGRRRVPAREIGRWFRTRALPVTPPSSSPPRAPSGAPRRSRRRRPGG